MKNYICKVTTYVTYTYRLKAESEEKAKERATEMFLDNHKATDIYIDKENYDVVDIEEN